MDATRRALLDRYLAAYNGADWDGLTDIVGPTYVHHNNGASLTLASFIGGAKWLRAAMPDLHVEPLDFVEEGDKVVVRFTATGTHSGSVTGESPTGKTVSLHGITIYRIEDDRIAEDWEAMDELTFMQQIGVIPS